jgi:hypothetical protein
MDAPATNKPSRLTDALLYLSVFVLLTFAILISGSGQWIMKQRAMQPTAKVSSTVDEDCPPCVAAAQERERLAAQALLDEQTDDQPNPISDDD